MHRDTLSLLTLIISASTLHNNADAAFRCLPRIAQSLKRHMRPTYCQVSIAKRLLTQQTASESATAPESKALVPLSDFYRLVKEESIERVRGAIEQGIDKNYLDATIEHAKTAEMFCLLAAQYRELDPKAVKRFLQRSRQREREELLLYSARFGNEALVRRFLQENVNINTPMHHSDHKTPLLEAVRAEQETVVQILLQAGADANVQLFFSRTPLMLSAMSGHEAIMSLLLRNGANVNAQEPCFGLSALMEAARSGQTGTTELLLQNGADMNLQDKVQRVAFHYAALHGHKNLVKLFLQRDQDIDTRDRFSCTALDYANNYASKGYHESVVTLLLKHGADATRYKRRGEMTTGGRCTTCENNPKVILKMTREACNKADSNDTNA